MRRTIVSCLVSLVAGLGVSAAEPVHDAATQYLVPTLTATNLDVQGRDLFRYGDDEDLRVNLGSNFLYLTQSPESTLSVTNRALFEFRGAPDARGHTLVDDLEGSYRRYFAGPRGIFAEGAFGSAVENVDGDAVEGQTELALRFAVGGGFGRVVDARTVAQAGAMCTLSAVRCDAKQLLQIAELVSKQEAGYYDAEYKLDAKRKFYAELAKAVGASDQFLLDQVLTSPLYKISAKRVGYEVGVRLRGLHGDLVKEDDAEDGGGTDLLVEQFARWGYLLNSRTALHAEETFTHGMKQLATSEDRLGGHPGQKNNLLTLEAGVGHDHSYQWTSRLTARLALLLPDQGDSQSNYSLVGETDVAVGTRATIGADLMLGNGDTAVALDEGLVELGVGDSEFHWQTTIRFRYFIF